MPFTLIKGEFVPEAGRPDGDSMRFRPDNADPIFKLKRRGSAPKINQNNGTIQLRFEGIDTMESKAADPWSSDATQSNLDLCGVPNGTGTAPGYILTNQIGPNGRPIAFVYSGHANEQDGDDTIFLDGERLKDSINYKQLESGHAYPLFYDTLFSSLRRELISAVNAAREANLNVWSADETMSGADYSGPQSLETMKPIFPKLWRRLQKYSRDSDTMDPNTLDEFMDYMSSIREERLFILSQGNSTGFDNIIEVNGNKIKLLHQPEDIVVVSV